MINRILCLGVALVGLTTVAAWAKDSTGTMHGAYAPDIRYPEFMPMWREGWPWKDDKGEKMQYARLDMPLGGHLFAYFQNNSDKPLEAKDVLLNGVSLTQGVAPERKIKNPVEDKIPYHLQFSQLPKDQIERLVAAGEPVWWKVEPPVLAPGQMGEVTIRLRRDPQVKTLEITIPGQGGQALTGTVQVDQRQPRFFSINFSADFKTVFAYLRHPSGKGQAPKRVLIDGQDVTAACRIGADTAVDTVPVVISLSDALAKGSYHVFRADYTDGRTAMAGLRAWHPGMVYGMWGYIHYGNTEKELVDYFLDQMTSHGINALMYSIPGAVGKFLNTDEGDVYTKKTGLRVMETYPGVRRNAVYDFLTDEPDAADYMSKMLPPAKRIGSLAQWLVERHQGFLREDPATPTLLNIDNTFKPENWYTYAQVSDIPCADPYYQEGVQSVLHNDPGNMAAYLKPTYVYGVGTIYQSAGAPNPMHLILHTCRFDRPKERTPYRAPTPEEKRIEVYYALAAGAKAISYWWFTPYGELYGCGGSTPDMKALWKEIGLLGAELETAGPLIIRSSPADLPTQGSRWLWTRTLLAGADTVVALLVNDNFFSDRLGTLIKPIENAHLSLQMPTWLKASEVFELSCNGIADVDWNAAGNQVKLNLGTVNVTRMVVVTQDKRLRQRLQKRYDQKSAANVQRLLTEK